jgi:hypothetical protein
VEGSHFEVENDYAVLVYHQAPGDRYARLAGRRALTSRNIY